MYSSLIRVVQVETLEGAVATGKKKKHEGRKILSKARFYF